jgi:hypothetical protein
MSSARLAFDPGAVLVRQIIRSDEVTVYRDVYYVWSVVSALPDRHSPREVPPKLDKYADTIPRWPR